MVVNLDLFILSYVFLAIISDLPIVLQPGLCVPSDNFFRYYIDSLLLLTLYRSELKLWRTALETLGRICRLVLEMTR